MSQNTGMKRPNPPLQRGKALPLRQAIRRMHRRYAKALERLAK